MDDGGRCVFCEPDDARVFFEDADLRLIWDAFPVTEGHALVVPRRHVAGWFDATQDEQVALLAGIQRARDVVTERYGATDFNIGINVGPAAGQTVAHLHIHVIPRRPGDVADPRGGVRHVIPGKGNYLAEPGTALGQALVTGGDDPLLPHLRAHLDEAVRADIAVAFILDSGVDLLAPHLQDLLDRGGRLRLLTGDYLQVTSPDALRRLLDLAASNPDQVEARIFETTGSSFHPKAYVFHTDGGDSIAFVGSSNLTAEALARGIEWNYRVVVARDRAGFDEVTHAFDTLFVHPNTRPLTDRWIDEYAPRWRPPPRPTRAPAEIASEEPTAAPEPHDIQVEALAALERTRVNGNTAGLVVLATGLGKTWLAAFDTVRARASRVLFVAHREEILRQARDTFRRIRPRAYLGFYTGQDKAPDADVVFASIQTLGRARHLDRFAPDEFDYIVVDEFHHAAAATYRRLLDHFTPRFLLGLTATPERTDGGDLLALCGENLVYRCDLTEGIERGLLAPFHYFGVPDEVDYAQIPWRGSRFDEQALELAVATHVRAENAFEQHQRLAGGRTLAFCVSTRHADFMRDFFAARGLSAAAVHSDVTSDPRATSLDKLRAGELDVVFAVDMFNEGVDVPDIDTVMMLRPTESRIVWLQQFGRGLRKAAGKDRLTVIDYIGNHRVFLTKPQALFGLPEGDAHLVSALDSLLRGELELPPGCEVTYELEAVDILKSLTRTSAADQLRLWYEDFRSRHGVRPTATEALHAGFNPGALRGSHGSWLGFVDAMGDLGASERAVRDDGDAGAFLSHLETTSMTRSYKMLVLLGLLSADAFPGELEIEALTDEVARRASRSPASRADLSVDVEDRGALQSLLVKNPIHFWSLGKGTGGAPFFTYEDGAFATTFDVADELREPLRELTRELAEWRLASYLLSKPAPSTEAFVVKVNHTGGRPILFPLERNRHPQIPTGWTRVEIDGEPYEANFVKVAVNVMRRPGQTDNVLAELLRGMFGDNAGAPGTSQYVRFTSGADGSWRMEIAAQG